jgi:DNA repair exonuclease SbcCD ATPase subunit
MDTALRVATAWSGAKAPAGGAPMTGGATTPPPLSGILSGPAAQPAKPASPLGASAAFLTPRVVDQRLFEDFAGQLRELAAQADARAAALSEATSRAEAAARSTQESTRQHRAAVEVLGKLLHALNARTTEVDGLIRRADERLAAASVAEQRLALTAEKVTAEFERKFTERLEALGRAGAADGVAALVEDAERVKDQLHAAARRLADVCGQAGADADAMEARLARLQEHAGLLVEQTGAAAESLKQQIDAADSLGAVAFQRINEAADAAAPLENLLGSCARADDSLRESLQRIDGAREASAGIAQQLASLIHRADVSREELRAWSGVLEMASGTGPLPQPLEKIAREFRTSLAQDLAKMASAMSLIARRAETTIRHGSGADASPEIVIRVAKDQRDVVGDGVE